MTLTTDIMQAPTEQVSTGAIVIISGEYLPTAVDNVMIDEPVFLVAGEIAPEMDENDLTWELAEAFDFAS